MDFRLQDENRRLIQERAENQEVILLLQTQKDILAKTVSQSFGLFHPVYPKGIALIPCVILVVFVKSEEDSVNRKNDVEKLQAKIQQLTTEKLNLR